MKKRITIVSFFLWVAWIATATLQAATGIIRPSSGQTAASAQPTIIVPASLAPTTHVSIIKNLPLSGILPDITPLSPVLISPVLPQSALKKVQAPTILQSGPAPTQVPAQPVETPQIQATPANPDTAQNRSRRIDSQFEALKNLFKGKRGESIMENAAVAANALDAIVGRVRQGFDAQIAAMRLVTPKDDADLLQLISDESNDRLDEIDQLMASGHIDPRVSLRTSETDAPKPVVNRELRIGVYPVAGDPLQWGHLLIALRAISALQLDKIVFIPAGDDPRKPNMTPAAFRHPMARAVLERFAPFFDYSAIALGTNYDGETNLFRMLALNPAQKTKAFYLVGGDHYQLKDKNGNPDTLPKLEAHSKDPAMNRHPDKHTVEAVFTEREGSEGDVPTSLGVYFMPKIPFETSSTLVRQGRHALMPYAAYEYVQNHQPGLYGVPPKEMP